MATITLRPDATTLMPNPPWGLTGAGAAHTALNDNSDTTYVAHDTSELNYILKVAFATSAIPAGAQIRLVTFRYRLQFPNWVTGDNRQYAALMRTINTEGYEVTRQVDTLTGASNGIVTVTGTAQPTDPGGGSWAQSEIDQLEAHFWLAGGAIGSSAFRLLEIYADVLYNEKPAAVVTAPAEGSTINTTRPTVAWTYTDPENDGQDRYWSKLFTAAQYGALDFNPDISLTTWDSGEVYSELKAFNLPIDLLSGTTYRIYTKVADVLSSGRWSDWDYNQFTVSITPPAVPIVTATPNNTEGYVLVSVQGGDNLLADNEASAETDVSLWTNFANATLASSAAWAADGLKSIQMSSIAAGDMEIRTANGVSGKPVTPNKTYTAAATFRAATVARNVQVGIAWFDSAGTIIGAAVYGTAVADATGADVLASVTAVAPANAAFATVRLLVKATGGAAEVHRADAVILRPGTSTAFTRGGAASSVVFILEYSDDGGTTWKTHRIGEAMIPDSVANQIATLRDYEIAPGVQRLYRARSMAVL